MIKGWKWLPRKIDLGVVISNDLKVSQQCQQAYNRASRILGLLNRTIQYKNTGIVVYYSAFTSHWSDRMWSVAYLHGHLITRRIEIRVRIRVRLRVALFKHFLSENDEND